MTLYILVMDSHWLNWFDWLLFAKCVLSYIVGSSLYTPLYTSLFISFLTCTLMLCLFGSLQSLCGELTIKYQPILSKADLLSCLSTTIALVHEPPLPNGLVNLQQSDSGAQCGAYGQWTGPHTHRCNTHLLGDIAIHPPLRRQHHQLAHVGQLAADSRSHTKNDFFQRKNTEGQNEAVCYTIIHTNSAGGLCQVTNRGHCDLFSRQTGSLSRGGTKTHSWGWRRLCSELCDSARAPNSNSARGTEHLWCHGHVWQLYHWTVFGLVQVRSIFHFFAAVPLQIKAEACLPNLTFIIKSYLIRF